MVDAEVIVRTPQLRAALAGLPLVPLLGGRRGVGARRLAGGGAA